MARATPEWIRSYQRRWLGTDVVAGVTLAAVAIPETMGYTSIAQTPIVTGLYTVIFPAAVFALVGSSRLLVVGADSATAAILSAGLAGLGIATLTPYSAQWLAWAGLVALVSGGLLLLARILRLGFLGDFLSASVLVGFLTGVGIQVLTGQLPDMLGIPKPSGNWFQQQWETLKSIPHLNVPTTLFAVGTVLTILAFKRFVPAIPGAIVAVVAAIVVASVLPVASAGVARVGQVQGGFPPLGLPQGISWADAASVLAIAFSCTVLIIAQSAATSRSFAMKHGQRVDVNRDIVGLSGGNLAAGLSGTFVVNGSPTKTQILDSVRGRTQLANLTMAGVVLLVAMFATGLLANMPKAVLGGIVFLIGFDLIDGHGLRKIKAERFSEFVIATVTAVTVFAVGVEQGILLAIVLSIAEIIRRQYTPRDFVVTVHGDGEPAYAAAKPGVQSEPGLVVFRYDADLFFANASRFVEDVQAIVEGAPDPVRWLVLDCSGIVDVDYSAGRSLADLADWVKARTATLAVAGADAGLLSSLRTYGIIDRIGVDHVYATIHDAVVAFRRTVAPAR